MPRRNGSGGPDGPGPVLSPNGTDVAGGTVLAGSTVVLGVGGGIAAYKAVEVLRGLSRLGAEVVPLVTDAATHFVGRATFAALCPEPVRASLWDGPEPVPHTAIGRRADLVVLAPCTADLLAKLAQGHADDLLSATALATRAPLLLAPAMHSEMWEHPAVEANVGILLSRGASLVGPATGDLAAGDSGVGRMAEPAEIVEEAARLLAAGHRPGGQSGGGQSGASGSMAGRAVLVSAGGTREPVDQVRFLGNRSSGRQGHALAAEAASRGARVVLVTTSSLPVPGGVEVVRVETAQEMGEALGKRAGEMDLVVMAAAVSDFRPTAPVEGKMDRSGGRVHLALEPTEDILAGLAKNRRPGQVLVGFAAEVGHDDARAAQKLARKGVDLLVVNDISEEGAGFEVATNSVRILSREGVVAVTGPVPKEAVARRVLDVSASLLAT